MSTAHRSGALTAILLVLVQVVAAIVLGATGAAAQEPEPDPGAPDADIEPPPGTAVVISPADPGSFAREFVFADELAAGSVLRVRGIGFESGPGEVRQCVFGSELRCANRLDIDFDDDGTAAFHYALGDPSSEADGGCGPTGDRCFVLVADEAGNHAEIDTVFGASAPPAGSVRTRPGTPVAGEDTVVGVSVADFPPGAATVLLCAAPAMGGTERCRALSARGALEVDEDGTGSVSVVVAPGSVGTERLPCEWRHDCAIVVDSEESFARAPARPVAFAAPEGAGYQAGRLLIGVVIAAVLVGVAIWLLFSTNWSPVGEAAAPEIDEAEYADLDEIISALEPTEQYETL